MAATDYSTECGQLPLSFYQMLAACIREYGGHTYINTVYVQAACDTLTSFWDCDNNAMDPERALVENCFAIDECGNLALKVFLNTGEAPQ